MRRERLAGKAMLVTGAAGGIGRATAGRLASEGASLVLADFNAEGLEIVADELAATGLRPDLIQYDAADVGSSRQLVNQAIAKLGRLDAVCNIGGIFLKAHSDKMSVEDWERILNINLTSVFAISQAALPALIAARGALVNTASIAGLEGLPYCAAYAVSKAGVITLTKTLAAEFAAAGLRANVVCPGGIRTSMGGSASLPDADPDLAIRRSKLPGFDGLGDPDDIAAAFAYLVSDDARFVSGTVLTVDGAQQLL
jgi:NAD(P)-dependent dehydrogenase (short-subunit alcohol dehydrogenase family)